MLGICNKTVRVSDLATATVVSQVNDCWEGMHYLVCDSEKGRAGAHQGVVGGAVEQRSRLGELQKESGLTTEDVVASCTTKWALESRIYNGFRTSIGFTMLEVSKLEFSK